MEGRLSERRREGAAQLGMFVATLGWGGAFIAGKLALQDFDARSAAAWRYMAALVVLAPFAIRHLRHADLVGAAAPLMVMVLCGGVLYPWLFLEALRRTSATNTALIVALMPVFTCIICPLVGEKVSRRAWVGVAIALVGAVVVISRGDFRALASLHQLNRGDMIAALAAAIWALHNLASRRAAAVLPAALINAVLYGCGGAVLMVMALPEAPLVQLSGAAMPAVAAVAFLGIVSSAASGQLYIHCIRSVGVRRTVAFAYCVPFVTAVLAAVFLGESISEAQWLGGVLVFAGLVLSSQSQ